MIVSILAERSQILVLELKRTIQKMVKNTDFAIRIEIEPSDYTL